MHYYHEVLVCMHYYHEVLVCMHYYHEVLVCIIITRYLYVLLS